MKRPSLEEKEVFNPEETVTFYNLSRRKFYRLLQGNETLPFIALYNERKLIIRSEYETYMKNHPKIKDGLKNGRASVPKKA